MECPSTWSPATSGVGETPRGESPRHLKKILEASPLSEKHPPDGKPSQEEGARQEAANRLPGAADRAGGDGAARGADLPAQALTFRPRR